MPAHKVSIILASESLARKNMLQAAGLDFTAVPARIDENTLTEDMKRQKFSTQAVALELSKKKALRVAEDYPSELVIGADQVLEFEGRMLTKAATVADAKAKLKALRGRTHKLISAVSVVKGSTVLWSHIDEAQLTMHDFDSGFLDIYCAKAGDALTRAVGAYELESSGAWLFSSVRGDYFTILGIPLLPLITYLRTYHDMQP